VGGGRIGIIHLLILVGRVGVCIHRVIVDGSCPRDVHMRYRVFPGSRGRRG
jgi:hypothetical protein